MSRNFSLKGFLAFALCFALVFATACNSGGGKTAATSSPGSTAGTSSAPNGTDASKQVELTFWSWTPENIEWEQISKAFNQKYPNIKINYVQTVKAEYEKKLKVAVQSGQAPDLMGLQLGSLAKSYQSVLEPLGPFAEKSLGKDWKNQFKEPPIARAAQYDFKAMPTGIVNTPYIAYDVDMFKKAGATPPATYDELKAAIKKFEAAKIDGVIPRLGIAGGEWLSGLRDFYLNVANQVAPGKIYEATAGKINFTDPDLVKSVEVFKQFYTDNVFQEGNLGVKWNPQLRDMFLQKQQLPMIMIGSWILQDVANKDALKMGDKNFGLIPFPAVQGGKQIVLTDGDLALAVNKNSKHKEEAWKFIEFMLTGEWQQSLSQKLTFVPIKKDLGLDDSKLKTPSEKEAAKLVSKMVSENAGGARFLDYPEIDDALFTNLQKVAAGELTPQQAMENVQKESAKVKR